jgi:hypothetical protein
VAETSLRGRCLCGAVHYESGPPVSRAAFCHCESCRRASGAHIVAWTTVRRDGYTITRGMPREFGSSPPVRRTFCGDCGTPLTYSHTEAPDTVDVTIATVDDPGAIAPIDHLWMEDAVAWDRPCDGLPQYRTTRAAAEPFGG